MFDGVQCAGKRLREGRSGTEHGAGVEGERGGVVAFWREAVADGGERTENRELRATTCCFRKEQSPTQSLQRDHGR